MILLPEAGCVTPPIPNLGTVFPIPKPPADVVGAGCAPKENPDVGAAEEAGVEKEKRPLG